MSINGKSIVATEINDEKDPIFVGDIGKVFKMYSGIDMTGATSIVFNIKKPDGSIVNWTATIDSNPRYANYTTIADDLDLEGDWILSMKITFSATSVHKGKSYHFSVYKQFEDEYVPEPH